MCANQVYVVETGENKNFQLTAVSGPCVFGVVGCAGLLGKF